MVAFVNNMKTLFLLAALTALLLWAGTALGGPEMFIPMLIFSGILNLGAWFFSDTIAIKAMRGREITAETGGDLYRLVDELRKRANLPMPKVYLCPHEAPNAFATGPYPSKAAVAFTQGAVNLLNREEMAGVVAHELAHIKNRDTLTSTVAATVAGVRAFAAQWFFFLGIGRREGGNPLVGFAVIIMAAVGAALIKAAISRSREFVADAEGAKIAGSPDGLINALLKLEAINQRVPLDNPNPAANNLFIIEPLAGGRSLVQLFATHPPTQARVDALMKANGSV